MSIITNIEDDFVKVEHFIVGILTAIGPVVAIVNPQLAGEAKLAVDVLNALALNASEITTQTAISTAIAAINANPSIAASVLGKINLSAVVANTNTVLTAVNNVDSIISNGDGTMPQSPQSVSVISNSSGDAS